jgi:hypothetical protein
MGELMAGEVDLDDPHRVPPTDERRRCRLRIMILSIELIIDKFNSRAHETANYGDKQQVDMCQAAGQAFYVVQAGLCAIA